MKTLCGFLKFRRNMVIPSQSSRDINTQVFDMIRLKIKLLFGTNLILSGRKSKPRKLIEVLSEQPLYVNVSLLYTEQKKILNKSALVLSVEAHEAPNLTIEGIGVLPESL